MEEAELPLHPMIERMKKWQEQREDVVSSVLLSKLEKEVKIAEGDMDEEDPLCFVDSGSTIMLFGDQWSRFAEGKTESNRKMRMADDSLSKLDFEGKYLYFQASVKLGMDGALISSGLIEDRYSGLGWRIVESDKKMMLMRFDAKEERVIDRVFLASREGPGRLYQTTESVLRAALEYVEATRGNIQAMVRKAIHDIEARDKVEVVHRTLLHSNGIKDQVARGHLLNCDWVEEQPKYGDRCF